MLVTAEAGAWMPYSATVWAHIQSFEMVHSNITPLVEREHRQDHWDAGNSLISEMSLGNGPVFVMHRNLEPDQ